jgi:hypothetical protein
MKSSLKKCQIAVLLVVVLALLLVQVPNVYSVEFNAPEKALTFLRDVVKLDMSKYDAKLISHIDIPSDLVASATEEVKYNLESAESKIEVFCTFTNSALRSCNLYMLEGSPLHEKPSANVLEAVKGFLQRYQIYSGAEYIQEMRDVLDTIDEIKPMTKTSGNLKLEISINKHWTYIDWLFTFNGIDVKGKKVGFVFENGYLTGFMDQLDLLNVGSTDVNVSEEEAIRIARERAENFTLKIWQNEWIEVEFDLVNEPLVTEFSMQTREPETLYPLWDVQLYFDKDYYGWTGIKVRIWADTAEVVSVTATGGLGVPEEETPTETSTDDYSNQTGLDPTPILIAVLFMLAAIIVGAMFYKRKRAAIH